ncbi:hypothetical protein ACFDAU_16260 [Sulfuriferula sp. GW1]|uniref:hypothetical protein n=1 Tax=Sulfuriferula sp. GW1 TaxID=3345111 RepID=UPI0039B0C62F
MKIALLLGAGFSYDLGMPISSEMTEVFLGMFNEANTTKLSATMAHQEPFGNDRPINSKAIEEAFSLLLQYKRDKGTNYEEFLTIIQERTERFTAGHSQSDRDSYHFVFGVLYDMIHTVLSLYQAIAYEVLYPKNAQWFSKLDNILSDQGETWVVSLNHDLFLECLAIDFGIPITYGATNQRVFPVSNLAMHDCVAFSSIDRSTYNAGSTGFMRGQRGINLVKLHGSLTEHQYRDSEEILNPTLQRISSSELIRDFHRIQGMGYFYQGRLMPSGRERAITGPNGELDLMSKAILTGGRKYSRVAKTKMGEEKLAIFDGILRQVDQLTIIGYGFGDRHVNFRIQNEMARRDELVVHVVDPQLSDLPDCLNPFDYDSRVTRARCGAAHWLDYCNTKRWNLDQMNCLKENAALRDTIRQQVEVAVRYGKPARK